MNTYGKELILDLHNCDPKTFNRKTIRNYFKKLCSLLDMKRCKLSWWDDLYTPAAEKETLSHLVGTSAVQFIKTSNITIHALDILRQVYINIFSCKDFDEGAVVLFTVNCFKGKIVASHIIERR